MKTLRTVLLTCIFLSSIQLNAQEKWSRLKIYPPQDKHQRAELLGLLQIDHFVTDEDGGIISEISEKDLSRLKASGHKYKILVPDVVKELDSLNKHYYASVKNKRNNNRVAFEGNGKTLNNIIQTPSAFIVQPTFGGYYSFAQMEAAMNSLVATYPAIAQKISIGKTRENRDIWVIKISDNVTTDESSEPGILYMGLQHAREAITGASMIFFMQYLCENYALDNRIKNLIDNREFYIIPCFNPDGWEYNRTSMGGAPGGGWRKNRNYLDSTVTPPKGRETEPTITYAAERGVDLNRNWGVDWANCNAPINGPSSSCGSGSFSSDTYWGAAAFSEAETQAVRAFTKSKRIVAGFDQHAYGPYYSLPFGRQALHTMPQKGKDFYTAIPAIMGTYNGMRAADSYDALGYEVAGGFKDWMLMGEIGVGTKDTVWAMTGEGGAGGGTGGSYGSFWAPASQIVNLCKGMTYQNLQLAYAAGTYVDIQDANDIAITALNGNLNFNIKRIGIGNKPVTVTLIPLENIQSVGAPVTINSMTYYASLTNSIAYTLKSTLTNGQKIKYAWQVSTDGYSYTDTIIKIFNPTVLFYDDMEQTLTTNWSTESNVADGWSYSNLAAFSGTKSLTESPAGNYTSTTTRTITYTGGNGWFDLTNATAAYLSFWVKHKAENFRDKLQVQVSTNGSSWTAIAGKYTVQEPGTLDGSTINGQPSLTGIKDYWVQEFFDLDAYKGQPRLYLRFVFTSDGDPSSFKWERDDGFYIDDVKLVKSSAIFTVLPAKNIDVTASYNSNKTVNINWSTQAITNLSHFEIERSVDGVNFKNIGQTTGFDFLDKTAVNGNNHYRIKQFDKSGDYWYSKVVQVLIEENYTVKIHPNPVNDVLYIKINHVNEPGIKVQVTDVQGRVIYSAARATASASELKIDTRGWKPQVYILKILNGSGVPLSTQKIIKN